MKSKRKKILLLLIVAIVFAVIFYNYSNSKRKSKLTFHEDEVKRTDFTETILSTGTVAPENRLDIKAPIAGRMDQLNVSEGMRVKKGQILAQISSTERAAMLDSARSEGPEALKKWEEYYKPTSIYAPIDGIIILQNSWPGQSFATSDALLTMSDRLSVKAQVDETDIGRVKLQMPAELTLDAYPNSAIEAKVVHIAFDSKTVNSVTTYIVDVLPKKVPPFMLSGMTANVRFVVQSLPQVLTIPNEAIATVNGETCVRVPTGNLKENRSQCVSAQFGPSTNGRTVIKSGLTEGQKILIADLRDLGSKSDANKNPFFKAPGGGGGKRSP